MPESGKIEWQDLTVPDADRVADFYAAVAGWTKVGHDMGGYEDFEMHSETGCKAGICFKRGSNADLPSQWLVYITVGNLDAALERVLAMGGKVLDGPRPMGGKFACIQDPAGAVCALWEPAPE